MLAPAMDTGTTAAAPLLSPSSFNHCASLSLSLSLSLPPDSLFSFPGGVVWCGAELLAAAASASASRRVRVRKLPTLFLRGLFLLQPSCHFAAASHPKLSISPTRASVIHPLYCLLLLPSRIDRLARLLCSAHRLLVERLQIQICCHCCYLLLRLFASVPRFYYRLLLLSCAAPR
jgi:hypothetical protein